jgi:pheromone shutdown protein TraB
MDFINKNNNIIVNFLMICLIVIFGYQTYLMKESVKSTHKLKIITQNNKNIQKDNILKNNILETELKRIEDINDKRFDLLSWFLGILFSILTVFISFQFIISKTTVRDIAYEELNKIIPDINQLIEERNKFIKSEISEMKNNTTND